MCAATANLVRYLPFFYTDGMTVETAQKGK
jgi:hypothetical protein